MGVNTAITADKTWLPSLKQTFVCPNTDIKPKQPDDYLKLITFNVGNLSFCGIKEEKVEYKSF